MAAMIVEYRSEQEFFEGQIGNIPRKDLLQKRWHVFRRSWELEQVLTGKTDASVRAFSSSSEREAGLFSWLLEADPCCAELRVPTAKTCEDRKLSTKPATSVTSGPPAKCALQLSNPATHEFNKGTIASSAKPLKSCLVLRSRSLEEKSRKSVNLRVAPKQSRSLGSESDDSDEDISSGENSILEKPVSPTAQKSVHFPEDEYLVEVRNFVPSRDSLNNLANFDGQQVRPKSGDYASGLMLASRSPPELLLCFSAPVEADFDTRVAEQCVCMEKAGQRLRTLTGVVGVRNLAYEKEVTVRYTLDSWKTFSDLAAQYIPNSTDGFRDRFMFNLTLPKQFKEMEFAVRYRVDGKEFWDSNSNRNYRVVDALQGAVLSAS